MKNTINKIFLILFTIILFISCNNLEKNETRERYKQVRMEKGVVEVLSKNPELLSILQTEGVPEGMTEEEIINAKASAKDQVVAKFVGKNVQKDAKGLESKEVTQATWKDLTNNPNLITGKEAKERVEAIPVGNREYKVELMERDVEIKLKDKVRFKGLLGHTVIPMIPDNQEDFFENEKLKDKYKGLGYPEPEKFGNKLGWTIAGFKGEEEKGEAKGKLVVRFNDKADTDVYKKINNWNNSTELTGEIIAEIKHSKMNDTELINSIMGKGIRYSKSEKFEKYSLIPINFIGYNEDMERDISVNWGYNCNTFSNTILKEVGIKVPFKNASILRLKTGKNTTFPLRKGEL